MTALDVDVADLTVADFTPELPCEHSDHQVQHDPTDPARWLVRSRCRACASGRLYLLCDSGRRRMAEPAILQCSRCKTTGTWGQMIVSCTPIPEAMGGAA